MAGKEELLQRARAVRPHPKIARPPPPGGIDVDNTSSPGLALARCDEGLIIAAEGDFGLGRSELLGGADTGDTEQHMVVAPLLDQDQASSTGSPRNSRSTAHGQRSTVYWRTRSAEPTSQHVTRLTHGQWRPQKPPSSPPAWA